MISLCTLCWLLESFPNTCTSYICKGFVIYPYTVRCLHSENETCTLGLLTSSSAYIQTNHLTTFNYSYVATRTPNSRRVYLETQDQNKNKLCVSDVVYGCKASIILHECFQEQDAITREDHNLWSLVHKRIMKTENWVENPKFSERTLSQCYFVYHKSQMTWSGFKPRPPRRDAVN